MHSLQYPENLTVSHLSYAELKAKVDLLPQICAILEACFTDWPDKDDRFTPENVLDRSIGFFDPEMCNYIVLTEGAKLIGMLSFADFSKSLFLFNLCVLPEYRNQGLASCLIGELTIVAFQKKKLSICGNVDTKNTNLVKYYAKKGAEIKAIGVGNRENLVSNKRFEKAFTEQELRQYLAQCQKSLDRLRDCGCIWKTFRFQMAIGVCVVLGAITYFALREEDTD
jgi:ribosomal protein S18 acetylase RimI-like enzyme